MSRSLANTVVSGVHQSVQWMTGFAGLPYLARSTFRHEQSALIAASLGTAIGAGGFAEFFLTKGFSGSSWLVSLLVAAPPGANMVAALLTNTLRRWRQPAVAAGCLWTAAAATAAVALLPARGEFAGLFVLLMVISTTAMMTSVQARTAIWQANYPAGARGGIVSRNFILQTTLLAFFAQSLGAALDLSHESYRVIYLAGAASFVVAGFYYRRIRVRRESLRIRRSATGGGRVSPWAIVAVLFRDRRFGWYMALQMLVGSATILVSPLIPGLLENVFGASYSSGNMALIVAPAAAQLLMIPALGGLFDRISIFRFRGFGSGIWAISSFVLAGAVLLASMPVLVVSMCITGIGQSFGRLSWSMGHMAFAGDEDAHLYMGAHLLLTGVRGLTVPFLGVFLYNHALGVHLIWISGAAQFVAAVGYWLSARCDSRPAVGKPTPSRAYTP